MINSMSAHEARENPNDPRDQIHRLQNDLFAYQLLSDKQHAEIVELKHQIRELNDRIDALTLDLAIKSYQD